MSYNLCPCELCDKPISLNHFPEAVRWIPEERNFWGFWSTPEDRAVYAHRFCWRVLPEDERRRIRKAAPKDGRPLSLGQTQ